ncbi:MAG: hypothetical protein SO022_12245 [Selenomonadaceae bacterium]|nr:hypothetical protein [Selenomonadaceae bacterium]
MINKISNNIGKIWILIFTIFIVCLLQFGINYKMDIPNNLLFPSSRAIDFTTSNVVASVLHKGTYKEPEKPQWLIEEEKQCQIANEWKYFSCYASITGWNNSVGIPQELCGYVKCDIIEFRQNIIYIFIFCTIGYFITLMILDKKRLLSINIKKVYLLSICIFSLFMLFGFVPYTYKTDPSSDFLGYGAIDMLPFGNVNISNNMIVINYTKMAINEVIIIIICSVLYLALTLKNEKGE